MTEQKIYRISDVCDVTGLRPSTIYKLVREDLFPRPVHLTARSTGWPSNQVQDWVAQRLEVAK